MIEVLVASNFYSNLDQLEAFVADVENMAPLARFLANLEDVAIPNIRQFPQFGPRYQFNSGSGERAAAMAMVSEISAALGIDPQEFRQYILDDFVVLYGLGKDVAYLLAVKHQRQLSYSFSTNPRS